MDHSVPLAERSVFLNVPFDPRYGGLFLSLIAGLTALGRDPHCVLEVPSSGRNRLDRIYELIASCGASVHDLSRVSLCGPLRVPRFNMPFELGLACSLARHAPHSFFVFEEKTYRLQASLSDLNGHDPHIHGGTQAGMLRCILDCFGTRARTPLSFETLRSMTQRLGRAVQKLRREQGFQDLFHPFLFRQTVQAAVDLAVMEGMIEQRGSGPP